MAAWRLMAHLTWAVVCSLLAVQQAAWAEEEEERLPGWKGEMQLEGKWDPLNHEPTKDPIPLPSSRGWVENVAWSVAEMPLGDATSTCPPLGPERPCGKVHRFA